MNFTSLENLQYFLGKLSYVSKESGLLNSIITSYLNDFKRDVVKIVSTLPLTGETGCLYLVPQGNNRFIEYYYNNDNNSFIQLGSSVFDVSVDSQLSNASENTLQNKVILNALDSKLNSSQLVNALNNSQTETPQSQVIYDAFGDKIDSEDFLNISNNNIDMLFLFEGRALEIVNSNSYYDFEIKIPYDSKSVNTAPLGTYADPGETYQYPHYGFSRTVLERFKFAGLSVKSYSNSTNKKVDVVFEDTNGNEYRAEVTTVNPGFTPPNGKRYWPLAAFEEYSKSSADKAVIDNYYYYYIEASHYIDSSLDIVFKIHFIDPFKIDNRFNISFYTSNYSLVWTWKGVYQRPSSSRIEYFKIRGSTDSENYTDVVDLRNVWVSDYFRYNQHIDEYLEDNENSKWEFNLF